MHQYKQYRPTSHALCENGLPETCRGVYCARSSSGSYSIREDLELGYLSFWSWNCRRYLTTTTMMMMMI